MAQNVPTRTVLSAAIAAALAGSGAAHAQQAIEEITVTATKRAEPMQDIPVSIQAMTGESLDELGVTTFNEYIDFLPNVVQSGRGPGQSVIYIRGASTEQSAITLTSVQASAPSVALYVDEQPVSFAGRNLDVYATDLERIEVLPGPQGTLFGASSQSGTIRLITNKPVPGIFETGFDTEISSTHGGEMSTSVEAYLNLPLAERLAVRIAAYTDSAGGWIDNVPGTYAADIEVLNRNQISSAAHVCTGNPAVDGPISGADCGGNRAIVHVADNSHLVEDDFNDATYRGARLGALYDINDEWSVLVQHHMQTLKTEGVFEYDPYVEGEESVNLFNPTRNQDEFGLTTWTVRGRLAELDLVYTGGFLDRDVFYQQDYSGYTNGGGYQAYYICTGGYSSFDECFDPVKQYLGNTTNERFTNEFRIATNPENRWRITSGIFIDEQESTSDGQFQYFGTVDAGFNHAQAPGTITDPANAPPTEGNIVSTVEGVTNPFSRGPATTFINNFTREESQIAVFGEFAFDITDQLTASIGARWYDLDYEFTGSTGSSFGCKGAATPCDGQGFDNRVSERLEAIGTYAETGDATLLDEFFVGTNASQLIQEGIADGTFFVEGLDSEGVINQDDTIWRATLNYHANPDVMVFGAYSQGFRPQTSNRNAGQPSANQSGVYEGYLVPAIGRTDELENYEIGIKADFFDGLVRLNATAYHSEITDLQISRFDPANVAFLVFIENAGDAEVDGLDADFQWNATNRLTVWGAASFVENELTRINPQLVDIVVPEGSRLPWTPEFSGNVRARYDFPLPEFGGDAYVRGSVTYTGDSRAMSTCNAYQIEDNTTQVFGNRSSLNIVEEGGFCGTPLTGDDLASVVDPSFVGVDENGDTRFIAARYEQEAYTLVNLAVGLSKDQWGAELFVDNVFDERAQVAINAADYSPSVATNRPRTIGLRFSFDYE